MLAGMAGFLIMGLAIPQAFGRDGVALGLGYLVVVLIHAGLYQRINSNIARVAPFNLAAALLVIGAGIAGGPAAYGLWAAAAGWPHPPPHPPSPFPAARRSGTRCGSAPNGTGWPRRPWPWPPRRSASR